MPDLHSRGGGAEQSSSAPHIDDLMLAMDVVDTLRHNQDFITRELDETRREVALIDRLREIYRGQGIMVADAVLQAGVQALKESRFVYSPPQPGWRTTLARLWVKRLKLGKAVLGAIAALALAVAVYHFGVVGPERRRVEALRIELSDRLPRALAQAPAEAVAEARVQPARDRVERIA